MKRLSVLLLVAALALVMLSAVPAHAKEPLRAETTHEFVGLVEFPYMLGWTGEITGDIDGCIEWWFDLRTWTPADPESPAQASHYEMVVTIYDSTWESGQQRCEGELLLETLERGTTTMANTTWRANGVVTTANGAFSHWLGRQVHESGEFVATVDPWTGTSLFRIN